jgi:hypothetical protein
MTEPEPRIVALIDAYAPAAAGTPDWQDVVRRASAPAARRLFTAPRILLIAAALVVVLAGSALAGVGPGRILLGLVRNDEPAPPTVKQALAHTFRWPHGTHVILSESRLVSRQTAVTRRDADGRGITQVVETWIAPLRDGGYCAGQHSSDGYSYSCIHGPLNPDVRLIHESPSGWRKTADAPTHWDQWVIDGTVPVATARVVLVHRDGTRTPVPLRRRPVGHVRYFAVRLRPQSAAGPAGPASFVALDADGRRLGAAALTRHDVRPLITTLGEPGPLGGGPTVEFGSTRGTFQGRPGTARLSVEVDPRTGRTQCLDVDFTSDSGRAGDGRYSSCTAPERGMAPQIDSNLGTHVAFGSVPKGTATAEMILKDGTRLAVPVHAHAYVVVIGNALYRSGNLPVRLVARDAGSDVVGRYVFHVHRDFLDY